MWNTRYPHSQAKRSVEYAVIFVGLVASAIEIFLYFKATAGTKTEKDKTFAILMDQLCVSALCVGSSVISYTMWQEGPKGYYRITDWLMTTPLGNLVLTFWYGSVAGVYAINRDMLTFGVRDGMVALLIAGAVFHYYQALRYLFGKSTHISESPPTIVEDDS